MEVKKTELKCCPNCGAHAVIHHRDNKCWCECSCCWTKGRRCDTEEEAIESWNSIKPKPQVQRCPNCGCSASLLSRNNKYWYECNSCWTQGDKCSSAEKASESWNALEPRAKKTRHEVLQEMGIANFATFLQTWEENHGSWADMTEDDIINWLSEEVDPELGELSNF